MPSIVAVSANDGIPFPVRRVGRARAQAIFALLENCYPDAVTELRYASPFELLIAVILSAQTTDAAVNSISGELFARYPTALELSVADVEEVDSCIRRLGLHKTKSRNIVAASAMLVRLHGGVVPNNREALEALPGVGRKTASVVLSVIFEEAAFAVDTHVFRVSQRLGLALGKTPLDIERQVTAQLPPAQWRHAHHWLILHGRRVCKAPRPRCAECPLREVCPSVAIVERYYDKAERDALHAKAKRVALKTKADAVALKPKVNGVAPKPKVVGVALRAEAQVAKIKADGMAVKAKIEGVAPK